MSSQNANKKQNKKTVNKSGSRKKPTKSQIEKMRVEEEKRREKVRERNRNIISAVLFLTAVLTALVALIPASDGTVWRSIRGALFGAFGFSSYLLPFILIYISIILILDKPSGYIFKKSSGWFLLLLSASSLLYVVLYDGEFIFSKDINGQFHSYFNEGKISHGFFPALLGGGFMLLGKSKAPAAAVLILIMAFSVILISGLSPAKIGEKINSREKNKEEDMEIPEKPVRRKENYQDESEDFLSSPKKSAQYKKPYQNESEEYFETPGRPKQKRGHLYVYTEKDLLNGGEEPKNAEQKNKKTKTPLKDNREQNVQNDEPDIFAIAAEKQKMEELEKSDPAELKDDGEEFNKRKKKSNIDINREKDIIESEINESETENENYILPPLSCLRQPVRSSYTASQADLKDVADRLIDALHSFNVEGKVVNVVPGPSVTRYEITPAPGVKISKFTSLSDDLALHLASPAGLRIEAPIPGKSAIGIEVPNRGRIPVTMREIVDSDEYRKNVEKSKLTVALGKDISGNVVCCDLAKMPHILIAGTTGSGKSVCLNSMITSLLFNASPSEVKLVLIDPKQVEFSVYNGIPHLLVPVVSDPKKAAGALGWAVTEMLNRYKTLNDAGVRDITAYNSMVEENNKNIDILSLEDSTEETDKNQITEKMNQIVIVIDELSDLMSVAPGEVEGSITRLAQMARAAGMHLVIATQRPSVDVITGLIKANIPSRIALSVSSQVDSRTILDAGGAEKLLGLGDMLYCPVGQNKPKRVQGCYLSDAEIERVVDFVKSQGKADYSDEIASEIEKESSNVSVKKRSSFSDDIKNSSDQDNEIIMKAAELVVNTPEKASISALQRSLSLGFAKAGRIMDALEERGIVGPHEGSKPRKVLLTKEQYYEMVNNE